MANAHVPLSIRTHGSVVDAALRTHVDKRLVRTLAKLGSRVERVSVRFKDINGPRGGIDQLCRLKVVLKDLPSVIVEDRAGDERLAFDGAAKKSGAAVRRAVDRAGRRSPSRSSSKKPAAAAPVEPRKGTRTNRKLRTKGMTAAFEEPGPRRPSRKSTRGSVNRAKQGSKLQRRQTGRTTSPQARAGRGTTNAPRKR